MTAPVPETVSSPRPARARSPGCAFRPARTAIIHRTAALALVALAARSAGAHEFRPAVLVLDEAADGRVEGRLELPPEPDLADLTIALPASCRPLAAAPGRLRADCGPAGLRGDLVVHNLVRGELLVRLRRAGVPETTLVVRPGDSPVPLAPAAAAPPGYFALGVAHIAGGLDHLLFVAGLTLLVRPALRLAGALTAFTAAHSLTLALAALGVLALPQPPVEACIALSLVLLARALARGERPSGAAAWRFAAACGLLHGLGFAGALADTGLPTDAAVPALLAFNAGVELGQLVAAGLVLALAALATRALARVPARAAALLRAAPPLALGGLAVAWTLERVLAFWTSP